MMVSGILLVTDGAPSLDGKAIAILCLGLLTLAACVAFLVWCHGWARRRWRDHWPVILLTCLWFGIGAGAAMLQMAKMPTAWQGPGKHLSLTGVVEKIDGRSSARLRLWLRVAPEGDLLPAELADVLPGYVARVSLDAADAAVRDSVGSGRNAALRPIRPGDRLHLRARLYPSPQPVLFGALDYARLARARDVVASGYVTRPPQLVETEEGWSNRLVRYRQLRADAIADGMSEPEGGIAAALLIGDRRHVDAQTYDMFRFSGLAHLLAISGLHMGLLCFGIIGFVRAVMALMPHTASRFALHKYASLIGLAGAALYVVLSGASISASRAFLMAVLIILAILTDRLALTLRNVAIAALILLAINPLALFSAGFQMSFAATTALVIWFERRVAKRGGSPPWRWFCELVMASMLASLATLPFTAQHFGLVTPWGVLANLVGIPLTGLWIMPAGLAVLATQLLPVPSFIADGCLWVMQAGLHMLVRVADWFANLPATPIAVPPPGAGLLYAVFLVVIFLLVVRISEANSQRHLRVIVPVILLLAGFIWASRPVADGILFARHVPQLILPVQAQADDKAANGGHSALAFATSQRQLSAFLSGNAARVLAIQHVVQARTSWVWHGTHSNTARVAVAMHRGALSRACQPPQSAAYGQAVRPDFVISLVPARYPCPGGVPLFSLVDVPSANYLLWLPDPARRKDPLILQNSSGQYLRINPVSRP